MFSSARGFRDSTFLGPPTSTPWSRERSRILATASCDESIQYFGLCFPIRWSELTTWPEQWWMLSPPELEQLQAGFSRIATSAPCRFIGPRPNKREGEHKSLSSLIRMNNRLRRDREKPSSPLTNLKVQGAEQE